MQNGKMRRIASLLKRHELRKTIKSVYTVLHTLGLRIAQDKTYIGRVIKGFDFLGFYCCPTGMTVSEASLSRRDQKIAQLYEQAHRKNTSGRTCDGGSGGLAGGGDYLVCGMLFYLL